jgi:ubiquinone/menaquinone biosynthesis C-methylase UbiE
MPEDRVRSALAGVRPFSTGGDEMSLADAPDNAIAIEAWDTVLFEKFRRFRWIMTAGLSVHSDSLLGRQPYEPGSRVLDVGCGFGDTTQRIAREVGSDGAAVGVDCAPNFVKTATREAEGAGIGNASFFVADVQRDDLRGPYDALFARFGTMFFNAPVAALRNMRRALRPEGRLAMIVWRRREDNAWVHEAEMRVKEIVPVVSHDETDQVHCGPGPFSMAGADLVSGMLRIAGFDKIGFERFDADICIGRTLEDAVEFAMALGPAGEIIRLAGEDGERLRPQVIEALRETFAGRVGPGGVTMPSSSWFVTARNPG